VMLRSPKPVLTGVLLRAESGELELTATDLELSIRVKLPNVEVKSPGAWVAPYAVLTAIVGASADPTLKLSQDKGTLVLAGADSQFKLFGWPAPHYPLLMEDAESDICTIDADALKVAINSVLDATASHDSRYARHSVLLDKTSR